jgi:hypothetical protein
MQVKHVISVRRESAKKRTQQREKRDLFGLPYASLGFHRGLIGRELDGVKQAFGEVGDGRLAITVEGDVGVEGVLAEQERQPHTDLGPRHGE